MLVELTAGDRRRVANCEHDLIGEIDERSVF
jgi:hypothetical protein